MKNIILMLFAIVVIESYVVHGCWNKNKGGDKAQKQSYDLFKENCVDNAPVSPQRNVDLRHILPKELDHVCQRYSNELDLRFKNYTKITASPQTFVNCDKLFSVDLSHNYIYEVDTDSFVPLTQLSVIRLGFNKLKKLTLDIGNQVQFIYLNDNELEDLTLKSSVGQASLDSLYVNNNFLTTINIPGNINIREINVVNNRLKTLDFARQIGTPHGAGMCIIRLSCNNLYGVDATPLTGFGGGIFASDTNIDGWQVIQIFKNPNQISVLDLSNNTKLTTIDWESSKYQNNIRAIELNGVGLTHLDETKLKKALPYLREIHLHRNKFKCDRLEQIMQAFKIYRVQVSASDCI